MFNRWEWLITNASLDVVDFDIHTKANLRIFNRTQPFYVMSYVKEGYAEVHMGNVRIPHGPGQLCIIPPDLPHDHYTPQGGLQTTFLWWHFTLTIQGAVDIMRLINAPATVDVKNTFAFENVFLQYVALYHQKPTIPNMVMKRAKGLEVMAHLLENMLDTIDEKELLLPEIPDAFFEIFKGVVEHPERSISLSELGEKYYMNSTYISNRFKKLFGITPVKLRHDLLLGRAKSMLAEGGKSISDIARELSFPDVSSFTRFFSTREGVAPSFYKEQKSPQEG